MKTYKVNANDVFENSAEGPFEFEAWVRLHTKGQAQAPRMAIAYGATRKEALAAAKKIATALNA